MMPSAGKKMMYTSGCPKNQNVCCQSRTSPPSAGLKRWVPTVRSELSDPAVKITAGIAKMTMTIEISIAHTKRGMRLSDMPGARCLNTVTMSEEATIRAETSVKLMIWTQASTLWPVEYCDEPSGT